jgi:hypothetical protein
MLEFLAREPDTRFAVEDGDSGRNRVRRAHGGFHLSGDVEVGRGGETVGDEGRFQRHDRRFLFERLGDL